MIWILNYHLQLTELMHVANDIAILNAEKGTSIPRRIFRTPYAFLGLTITSISRTTKDHVASGIYIRIWTHAPKVFIG